MTAQTKPEVSLVAATAHCRRSHSEDSSEEDSAQSLPVRDSSFYKNAQWTADGTTIITSSSTDQIDTFVLPEDLLSSRSDPLSLSSQHTITLPEPTHVVAPSPYFSLAHPITQTLLVAARDHPIHLYHALPDDSATGSTTRPIATFNLIKPQTEAYLCPTALIWPSPGTHFTTGTANLLAQFDITRPASTGPVLRIPTIPSTRHLSKGGGVGMRGTVSALAASPPDAAGTGLVAAGTWTRWVGLYDMARGGECAATWGVAKAVTDGTVGVDDVVGGQGILQTTWSPCGRYLVINERQSIGMLVYDVRVTGRLLAVLTGREALTHQRLSCDVYPGTADKGGFEVWAGTSSGTVKVWDAVGMSEGPVKPSWDWTAAGGAPIGSAAMHSSGSVVATCSGGWLVPEYGDSDGSEDSNSDTESSDDGAAPPASRVGRTENSQDNALKIWSLGFTNDDEAAE